MRSRPLLAALLVCAVTSLIATAVVDAASSRVFTGKTTQKRDIRLKVGPGSVTLVRFQARLACRDGSFLVVDESGFLPTRVGRGGLFRDLQVGRTDKVYLRGKVRRRVVQGRFRVEDDLRSGLHCGSRWIGFTARPGG